MQHLAISFRLLFWLPATSLLLLYQFLYNCYPGNLVASPTVYSPLPHPSSRITGFIISEYLFFPFSFYRVIFSDNSHLFQAGITLLNVPSSSHLASLFFPTSEDLFTDLFYSQSEIINSFQIFNSHSMLYFKLICAFNREITFDLYGSFSS